MEVNEGRLDSALYGPRYISFEMKNGENTLDIIRDQAEKLRLFLEEQTEKPHRTSYRGFAETGLEYQRRLEGIRHVYPVIGGSYARGPCFAVHGEKEQPVSGFSIVSLRDRIMIISTTVLDSRHEVMRRYADLLRNE